MLEFSLEVSICYRIYIDFMTHVFHLYILCDIYFDKEHKDERKDRQSLIVADEMSKKTKELQDKISYLLLCANFYKICFVLLEYNI